MKQKRKGDIKVEKNAILDKLAKMPLYELDILRDNTQVRLQEVLKEYHLAKDEEIVKRHEKRKKLLSESYSFSRVENMLRADDELYLLKRKVLALSTKKKEIKLEVEIINNYFWKAKG